MAVESGSGTLVSRGEGVWNQIPGYRASAAQIKARYPRAVFYQNPAVAQPQGRTHQYLSRLPSVPYLWLAVTGTTAAPIGAALDVYWTSTTDPWLSRQPTRSATASTISALPPMPAPSIKRPPQSDPLCRDQRDHHPS